MVQQGTYGSGRQLIRERGDILFPVASLFLPFSQGNIYHVRPANGNDGNYGDHPDSAYKTLAKAQAVATANQNDIVLLYYESNTAGSTTDYQSATLAWAKDNVHLIGVGAGPMIGQRARIAQLSSALTLGDLFSLSANNCLIQGIEIYQGAANAAPTQTYNRAMVLTGMRNRIINCQISGIGDTSMDLAGSCSLEVDGDENYFGDCYIGLDTYLRNGTATTEININGGTRNLFDRCIVNCFTSATTMKLITWAAGSYHTATWLRDCMLCAEQNRTGAAIPTGALLFNAAGQVFMYGGGVFGPANISTVTNANILVLSDQGLPTHADYPGIAVGQQTT